jgi:hypothetical protein
MAFQKDGNATALAGLCLRDSKETKNAALAGGRLRGTPHCARTEGSMTEVAGHQQDAHGKARIFISYSRTDFVLACGYGLCRSIGGGSQGARFRAVDRSARPHRAAGLVEGNCSLRGLVEAYRDPHRKSRHDRIRAVARCGRRRGRAPRDRLRSRRSTSALRPFILPRMLTAETGTLRTSISCLPSTKAQRSKGRVAYPASCRQTTHV